MFDAEKLLGKVLSSAAKKTKKKGKKKNKSNIFDSVGSQLTSGKGLMTVIGLGVGAYEILKTKQGTAQQNTSIPAPPPPNPAMVSPPAGPPAGSAPPPLPGAGSARPEPQQLTFTGGEEALAMRFIEIMVAAAYADGNMDEQEEQQILNRMKEQGLSSEEKSYLLAELHSPKSIAELTEGLSDPRLAQVAYGLAAATVEVDSDAEREWLNSLAAALSVSPALQEFIEEQ